MHEIMLVDDEKSIIQLIKYVLSGKPGINLTAVCSGEECVEKIKSGYRPCIILMDVMMPRQNGYETCKIIKNDLNLKEIKIFYFSALPEEVIRKKIPETGADGIINKDMPVSSMASEIIKRAE